MTSCIVAFDVKLFLIFDVKQEMPVKNKGPSGPIKVSGRGKNVYEEI